ncbi:pro-opiomelanocortin [Pteropus vampyrus]|uniref:Pro-opiomelanocortin n=1 Tax=Pteropus vampyrus TaxID=132908 RepID=A0A6P3PW76_PTEVA|nr:pro-opiomelanocortin [Pteropus vampyrus]
MPRSCCTRSGALLLALLLQASLEVHGWCLESSQCQDLTTESNLLVSAGDGGDGAEAGPREGKRSYSMEHFRWGKPVGKKRRPVKVYPNGAADESAEAFPLEFKRELAGERPELALSPEGPDEGAAARADLEYGLVAEAEAAAKKDEGPYRMEHFRWGSPPKDKRYGGFMTSEKSQTPLVTLFKNAIIKNAHKKGQ